MDDKYQARREWECRGASAPPEKLGGCSAPPGREKITAGLVFACGVEGRHLHDLPPGAGYLSISLVVASCKRCKDLFYLSDFSSPRARNRTPYIRP